jgi:hypothetical protein
MRNGPTSSNSNAEAPTMTPANHPNAHRVSLDVPCDSTANPHFVAACPMLREQRTHYLGRPSA